MDESPAEISARRRWLGFILGFFILQAALWTTALVFVTNDPSHAVLPNYSERALAWDAELDEIRRSRRLGWTATTELGPVRPSRSSPIVVHLEDRKGGPLAGAEVRATLFHQARASERQEIVFGEEGLGNYRAAAMITRSGRWRIEIRATRGQDHFRAEQSLTVGEAG